MERDREPWEEPNAEEPEGEAWPETARKAPADDDLLIVRTLADQLAIEPESLWRPPPLPPAPVRDATPPPEPEPIPVPEPFAAPAPPTRPSPTHEWDLESAAPPRPAARPSPLRARAPAQPTRSARSQREGRVATIRAAAMAGASLFAAATVLMALRVEPFSTWYYLFAWYPFLVAVHWGTAKAAPDHALCARSASAIALLFVWSVPIWLFFELWNFRLENWYYVGVPPDFAARRLGVILSFATVLPGILALDEWFKVRKMFARSRTPRFRAGPGLDWILLGTGALTALLVLAFPTVFFPLVWSVPVLLLEPWLRRGPGPSLLRELGDGRPERVLRLLVAGLGCGLVWESANFFAGGKWIYTVPGFEGSKLFEMPVVGFLGFAPFAMSCWVLARALVRLDLLPEWEVRARRAGEEGGGRRLGGRTRVVALSCAAAFSLATLGAMDRLTIDAFAPRPENLPNLPDGVLEYAREHGRTDVRGIIAMAEEGKFYVPGESSAHAMSLLAAQSRLVLLRGIGTENARRLDAVGVRSIAELAAQDPVELTEALSQIHEPGWWPRVRRVAVWVAAASRAYYP